MNFILQKKTKKSPKSGDIFTMQLKDHRFIFGMVLSDRASITSALNSKGPLLWDEGLDFPLWLVYIYNSISQSKAKVPRLLSKDLLIEPQIINKQGWLQGYFENVAHQEVTPEDFNPNTYWLDLSRNQYYSVDWINRTWEQCKNAPTSGWLCTFGVGNHRIIDDLVSNALHIPLSTDEIL